jgi:hypothetical protein
VPAVPSVNDSAAVELGMKFTSTIAGYITGVRFYKGAGNTGTHTGSLWSSSGTRLATGTFVNETAGGWQTLTFTTPVAITANTTYVVSYFAPSGHYSGDNDYFATAFTNGNLTAPSTSASGGNGLYRYGSAGGFPNATWQGSNYYVDVMFATDAAPPTVTAQAPLANATGVSRTVSPTVTFSEAVQASTITFELRDPAGVLVPGTVVNYDPNTRVATLVLAGPLLANTTYTATVSGVKDTAGNPMAAPLTWSFTTGAT